MLSFDNFVFKPTSKESLANKEEVDSLFQNYRGLGGELPVGALPAQISVKRD